ncbi:E3 ubiquitin-protein ligase MARCHF3-like [Anthonomus grandis grandis]|uniref:E3 ubiquitin-protein ligase MARCHF3-like n=1 Tax=Anthonomus grandis grandis TaxID=2921223 RepID=UPI002166353A|nr:E3 ubiquitin-protein ligase MARCHF3-like [Anthonomus grandis grandis]
MSQIILENSNKNSVPVTEPVRNPTKEIVITNAKIAPNLSFSNIPVCRICQTNSATEHLISPCNCKGTLAYIHLTCLERWLNQSGRNFCELCHFRYEAVQTQRYGLCEGLRIWICHPRNRTHIRSDLVIGVLLSLVTSGLLFICIYGMDYFTYQAEKVGIDKAWIRFTLITFLVIILLGYVTSIYLLLRDHFVPWYHWWTHAMNITLQIPCRRQCRQATDVS